MEAISAAGTVRVLVVLRSAVVRFFLGKLDRRFIALDQSTGKELWSTQLIDQKKGFLRPFSISTAARGAGFALARSYPQPLRIQQPKIYENATF